MQPRPIGTRRRTVKKVDLFSREWCDLIFHDRNKSYGAYKIRKEAGKRYRRALLWLFLSLLLFLGTPLGLHLYMRYQLYKSFTDFEKEIPKLKRKEAEKGHELKTISTGRARPTQSTIKGATTQAPELVEVTKKEIVFGTPGKETIFVDEDLTQLWEDLDSLHNRDQTDLPIEGPQLTHVDVVEEMPQFPGGVQALMQWMEENIPYPQKLIRAKVQGDMEVTFIVDREGNVGEAKITKSLHPDLDKLVMAAMKRMPKWKPGKKDGRVSIVSVSLPIHFDAGAQQKNS